jgi:4-phosphopantoate--beta-alanine ligase
MTNLIPKSHPRAKSLYVRERLVHAFDDGLVAKEGLMAHGRGEAFDYLIGEKTSKSAKNAIKAAAFALVSAEHPIISVNGNIAGLCPKEIVELAKATNAKIEINLFYSSEKRKQNILKVLRKNGAREILGVNRKNSARLSGLDSARRIVDKNGIYAADVVLVPLEDGDRTIALKKAGKKVITFDLNPLSRTAQSADITIVDNVVRGIKELIDTCVKMQKKNFHKVPFDNKKNLARSISEIRNYLTRRAKIA